MKGKITAACSAAAMAVFGSIALATPAQAADSEQACFKFEFGNSPWFESPVQLHVLTGDGWIVAASGNADADGCATFTLSGAYAELPSHVMAYQATLDPAGQVAWAWSAVSQNAPAEHGNFNLGTYYVQCTDGTEACPGVLSQ